MKTNQGPSKEELLEGILSPPAGSPSEFRILASPFRFGSERAAEALALDSVGRLTLVFLGQKDEEPWLLSLLDALSWMERHRALLETRFHLEGSPAASAPRLLLASTEFSREFCARVAGIGAAKIDLFEWEAVEIASERKLMFRRVSLRESTMHTSLFPAWALDAQGAALFREAVEKVSKIDSEISLDWGPGSLDLRFRGRLLGSLHPDEAGLSLRVPGNEDSDHRVADRAQLTRALDRVFREYMGSEIELSASAQQLESPEASSRSLAASSGRASLSRAELEAIAK